MASEGVHNLKIEVSSWDDRSSWAFDDNLLPYGGLHDLKCPRNSLSSAECLCWRRHVQFE